MIVENVPHMINALGFEIQELKARKKELSLNQSTMGNLGSDAVTGQDDTLVSRLDMSVADDKRTERIRIYSATEAEPSLDVLPE